MPRRSGEVRDAIIRYLRKRGGTASVAEIVEGVTNELGPVARSSVRSYLQIGVEGDRFERVAQGQYRLKP
jgi:site-specific DNA-methyltransferase (adenine-specific)